MVTMTTTSCSCLRLFGLTICIILLALASSEEADAVVPEKLIEDLAVTTSLIDGYLVIIHALIHSHYTCFNT